MADISLSTQNKGCVTWLGLDYNCLMFDFDEQKLADVPIVVLDTETTGLQPALGHRVVEIGAVRLENWAVVGEMNRVVNPGRDIPTEVSKIHTIYNEDVIGKPYFHELMPALNQLLDNALVVAHNASFDAGFLSMEYDIANQQSHSNASLPNPWLCTLQLARKHFHFGRNNLGNIARQLQVRMGQAHRAMNDVYMTVEVLKRMARQLEERRMKTVGDLLHAQGGAIFAPPSLPHVLLPRLLQAALDTQQDVIIHYSGAWGTTQRTITPYYVTSHKRVVYVIAFCHLRQDQRTFRLDRIVEVARI